MRLSPRLAAVLDLTPPVSVAADIGTDHALLPVAWIRAGKAQRVIASDLRAGPLAAAARTVAAAGLAGRIELRQGDGLTVLAVGEAELACLAGVGGAVMRRVLAAAEPLPVPRLLLQPMNGWAGVRRLAASLGLGLRQEVMVAEGERLYIILEVTRGGSETSWAGPPGLTPPAAAALWEAGPQLFHRRDPLLRRWLAARQAELAWRLADMAAGRGAAVAARRDDLRRRLLGLEELRQCW